jgi:hypothetical protein
MLNVPEQCVATVTLLTTPKCDDEMINKYLSAIRLQVIAYILCFMKNSNVPHKEGNWEH